MRELTEAEVERWAERLHSVCRELEPFSLWRNWESMDIWRQDTYRRAARQFITELREEER